MAYSRRSYKGAAVSNALGGSTLAAGSTSITLASAMSGWSTSGTPFFVVIDPGTAKEEKVCVIYNTSTSLTVVDPAVTSSWTASANGRGCDDTTDRQHDAGATIYPVFTATEANQANELVSKYGTNGDIVVHGTTGFKTVSTGGSGSNNKVLVADSSVTDGGVKWAQLTSDSIADLAITSAKIADGAIVNGDISGSAAIALSKLATGALPTSITVASANLVDGTIVDADINASAGIALSKLATGALPTNITVASANIVDGTIVNADINASAAIALSKLATGALPTGITVASANIVDLTVDTADIKDNAVTNAKLPANSFSVTYQDFVLTGVASNGFGGYSTQQTVSLTGGKKYTDVINVVCLGGVNAYGVYANITAMGVQSGVITDVQLTIDAAISNIVAGTTATVRVWLK